MKIGVVHGRFQPLHFGHITDYLLKAKEECDFLYIGITNSDTLHTLDNKVNPDRSKSENNPLSFIERLIIIRDTMIYYGFDLTKFDIVPFPINIPKLILNYVPLNSTHYLTIYDEWGKEKANRLKEHDLKIQILFEKDISEKKISATQVRNLILNDDDTWINLVPKPVADHLKRINLKDRLTKLRYSNSTDEQKCLPPT